MGKHYIATYGLQGGYVPDTCEPFETREQARDFLAEIAWMYVDSQYGSGRDDMSDAALDEAFADFDRATFMIDTDVETMPLDDWNYYAIDECDCDEPHVHSDSEVDWCPCPECKGE